MAQMANSRDHMLCYHLLVREKRVKEIVSCTNLAYVEQAPAPSTHQHTISSEQSLESGLYY